MEAKALASCDYPSSRNKRRILIQLAMEVGPYCEHCGRPVKFLWQSDMRPTSHNLATFDHRQTKCTGGKRTLENGILSCRKCNHLRGNMSVTEYREQLAAAGGNPMELQRRRGEAGKVKRQAKKDRQRLQYEGRLMKRIERTPRHVRTWYAGMLRAVYLVFNINRLGVVF